VEAINTIGEKFDPNIHEVVRAVEAGGKESGIIIEETQKGYKIDGNLLRPAKVKVAK
jgi:molecular chaperone GrpE